MDEGETAQLAVYVVLYGTAVHLVREGAVTAARLQQHANDVGVSVFAGTHQGRGALSVLCVYIRTAAQEQLYHGNAAMAYREHERRLARLEKEEEIRRIRIKWGRGIL